VLILGKWCDERANLLLGFQASARIEIVRIRGRISCLNPDGFLFLGTACSIAVPFEAATFEYVEGASDVRAHGQKERGRTCSLRLRLPASTTTRAVSSDTALASSIVSITEASC
jgi:hypothetical protein